MINKKVEYLVSIIIPCYNQGEYIQESINSALNQIYQNIEIIIVDDGSNDEYTLRILNQINNPKITVIHTKNKGASAARNNGIKIASGKFILPLDSDDLIHPSFLEKTVPILTNNKNIAIVGSYFEHFGNSSYQGKYCLSGYSDLYVKSDPNTLCTCLFRRSEWEFINGYDETMTLGLEDWEFWIRLLESTKKAVYVVPEILLYYRIKEQSTSTDVNANKDKRVRLLINRHYDLYKNNFVEAIIDREKKLIEVWGYVKEDNKKIKSLQAMNEDLASKLLISYLETVTIKSPVLIYGMSKVAEILLYLMREKGISVSGIIDQKAEKLPYMFSGINILPLSEAIRSMPKGIIIITSIMNHQLLQNLIIDELQLSSSVITTISIEGIHELV